MSAIYGIPCRLRDSKTKDAVRWTLDRIRLRCPLDFADLQKLVRKILPLSREQQRDGTMGEWKEEQPNQDDRGTWGYGFDRTPGVVFLSEHFETPEYAIASIAHEFGHACTRHTDLERRGDAFDSEWASELTADWYACIKWGFGKEIARHRKSRVVMHHGFKPGTVFQHGDRYLRITRNFCIRWATGHQEHQFRQAIASSRTT